MLRRDVQNNIVHGLQNPQRADVLLLGQHEPLLCLSATAHVLVALADQVKEHGVPVVKRGGLPEELQLAIGIGPVDFPGPFP